MDSNKERMLINMIVIHLTKYLMDKYKINERDAFIKLCNTHLYSELCDIDSRLAYEAERFLEDAIDIEIDFGPDILDKFLYENLKKSDLYKEKAMNLFD